MNRPYALDAVEDYQTKATLGITGWLCLSVQSDGTVRHLDVGSTYPGAGEGPKGLAVRQLKSYASWVQTVQHHFFIYLNINRESGAGHSESLEGKEQSNLNTVI